MVPLIALNQCGVFSGNDDKIALRDGPRVPALDARASKIFGVSSFFLFQFAPVVRVAEPSNT